MSNNICCECGVEKSLDLFPKASTCKDGHRNYCKLCYSKRKHKYYVDNREYVLSKTLEWQRNNPELRRCHRKIWADNNKEWATNYSRKWVEENRDHVNAKTSARRKRVRRNTPPWVDMSAIRSFYMSCPDGYQVDHIIPLNHKFVCGLHVMWNLQYLSASENASKGNKFAIH